MLFHILIIPFKHYDTYSLSESFNEVRNLAKSKEITLYNQIVRSYQMVSNLLTEAYSAAKDNDKTVVELIYQDPLNEDAIRHIINLYNNYYSVPTEISTAKIS